MTRRPRAEVDREIVAKAGPWMLKTCDLQTPHSTPQGSLSVITIQVAIPFVWARSASLAETMEALVRHLNRLRTTGKGKK